MFKPSSTQAAANKDSEDVGPSPAKTSLLLRVAISFSLMLIAAPALLFLPAGTFRFWQGWVFLAAMFVPALCAYGYFYKADPQLLERRLEQNEPVREQKLLMRWTKSLFIADLLLPGFDHRWGWSRTLLGEVPLWLCVLAQAMVLAGMLFAFWVIAVNRFAARTIRVEAGQTVVFTGPYAIVRHPMYLGSAVLWIFTPLALGSYVALPAFALLLPVYVLRLLNEEKLLREQLPGYTEYCRHTRFRLIPHIW